LHGDPRPQNLVYHEATETLYVIDFDQAEAHDLVTEIESEIDSEVLIFSALLQL
jgi:thiamine kinase-like enzyme